MSNEKNQLHPRNKHRTAYDFDQLIITCPELAPFVELNKYNNRSINFFDPNAVKMLNKALLFHHYGLKYWDIPPNYLCPPIPGRADYIHHIADLLAKDCDGRIPKGPSVTCLDIGVGANCVYPIIGSKEYGWSFVGSDVDEKAISSANTIIVSNPELQALIKLRLQKQAKHIFLNIIQKGEKFSLCICNPPFHASLAEAQSATRRKLKNLNKKSPKKLTQNFGGQANELWCEGGEKKFIQTMILQSKGFAKSCCWFSSLVSKEATLNSIYHSLKKAGVASVKTIAMGQGNKKSRIVAWTYLSNEERKKYFR